MEDTAKAYTELPPNVVGSGPHIADAAPHIAEAPDSFALGILSRRSCTIHRVVRADLNPIELIYESRNISLKSTQSRTKPHVWNYMHQMKKKMALGMDA